MDIVTISLNLMNTGTIPDPKGKWTKNKGKFCKSQIQQHRLNFFLLATFLNLYLRKLNFQTCKTIYNFFWPSAVKISDTLILYMRHFMYR